VVGWLIGWLVGWLVAWLLGCSMVVLRRKWSHKAVRPITSVAWFTRLTSLYYSISD